MRYSGSMIPNLPNNEKRAVKPSQYLVKKGKLLNQSDRSDILKSAILYYNCFSQPNLMQIKTSKNMIFSK